MSRGVCIFWDNSNIFIPAQYLALERDGVYSQKAVRIQFDHMYDLAHAHRSVLSGVCVGSVPPELERVWLRLRSTGVAVELYERGGQSGKEQGVDQCLQVHMLRVLADVSPPATVVLLTGDGAGYEDGVGYFADLERMAKAGWGIEVISWDRPCKRTLKEWAAANGAFIRLDDYYESVTFVEGGRRAKPLSLTHRPKSEPST